MRVLCTALNEPLILASKFSEPRTVTARLVTMPVPEPTTYVHGIALCTEMRGAPIDEKTLMQRFPFFRGLIGDTKTGDEVGRLHVCERHSRFDSVFCRFSPVIASVPESLSPRVGMAC